MNWHPIEQYRYRDAVRRWNERPCAAQPVPTPRAASRVQGLGVQLVVVNARTHTAVTDLPSSPLGGSVTALDLADRTVRSRQEDRECVGRGPATPPSPGPHSPGGVAPHAATGRERVPEPSRPVAPTATQARSAS